DQSAVSAVKKWRFEPGKRDGIASEMWHEIAIRFVLKDAS
ncbi:MAG: energy transducer TonB, partial [Enterobacteriaceae bacterium]